MRRNEEKHEQKTKLLRRIYYRICFIKPARSEGARAKLGLLMNEEDTIPTSLIQIGPRKCAFEKRILGTQISTKYKNSNEYHTQFFLCLNFFTTVPQEGPKSCPKFKKRRKMTKP